MNGINIAWNMDNMYYFNQRATYGAWGKSTTAQPIDDGVDILLHNPWSMG